MGRQPEDSVDAEAFQAMVVDTTMASSEGSLEIDPAALAEALAAEDSVDGGRVIPGDLLRPPDRSHVFSRLHNDRAELLERRHNAHVKSLLLREEADREAAGQARIGISEEEKAQACERLYQDAERRRKEWEEKRLAKQWAEQNQHWSGPRTQRSWGRDMRRKDDEGKHEEVEEGEEAEEGKEEATAGDAVAPAPEAVAPAPEAESAPSAVGPPVPVQPCAGEAVPAVVGGGEVVPARKSRLMIREIVLENFKSYGNKKVIGPFHKSFSSIVGPNGSGKSNTIDALLFVFGKRAKQMRLKKVSELIHGSKALPNCPSAKVSVTFQDIIDTGDGPEDYEIVQGSVLVVSREAFRNNSSKYYVDDKVSNFTEVTQLLRKRGVDLEHNRFLILQGEVEQISLMKPKAQGPHEDGLLEYLEDIIGSNRLLEPIEEAEGAVEKLTEVRQEKLNRLRVAERERDNLDGPRKEAEAWVNAEAERLELQALVAQAEARRNHGSIKGLEEEHKVLQGHMEEHRKKMEGFQKEVKAIETEHNTILKDYTEVKAQMEKAAGDFKEFERLDVKFTEDIAFQEQKLQKLQQTAEKEKESAANLLFDADKLRKEAPKREQELESAERHKASLAQKLEKIYEGLKGKAEELRPAKEAKEAELVPLQKKLTEVRKVVEVAQTEAELLRQKTSQVAAQIEDMKRQHGECAQHLTAREQELKETAKSKKERSTLIAEAKERLQQVSEQMEQVTQEVTTTRVKAEEAKSEFEQEHYRGRLIRAVYESSKAGKLRGVHGRLGDLGTIGKKYDVAVSTACSMLDAIVVDTTEDAQGVIEFIRREELGRSTCVCLQKIAEKSRDMEVPIQTPENVPRLIDLIKPAKPEYKVAFFFALGHTLVAKDLEQATRIGMQGSKRWRVVTLDGKLIDTSGTMSGGGNQVAKGGMRASLCQYSPEEVKGLVDAYEKANARLTAIRQERCALQEALQLTEKEIGEYDLRAKKCEMDISSLKKQMETYEARLKSLKVPTLSGDEKSKLKELEKTINGRSDELNKIQTKHHAVEEEVRELHNQIMNIGGEELKVAKEKLEESTKKCEDMRRNVKKALLDADNMVKNSKKAEVSAKEALKEHAAAEKTLESLKEEHAKLDDKAEAVLNEYNKRKEAVVEKDQVLTALRAKRDEVIQAASSLKSQEVDLVNEMEEKTRALKEIYGRIAAWGNKLQEARKEYKELPLDLLGELRTAKKAEGAAESDMGSELAKRAISSDLPGEELETVVRADVDARMLALEANVKNLKPNLTAIEEFRRADTEHTLRLGEYEEVHTKREEARTKLETLRQQRLEEFMDGFSIISMKLKEMYQMITLGGDAELELVDTLDPFSEGINFSVRPPKKSWKQITNLSGGEKTLASLSLVFALHHFKPTPLYFMDEIDAALDFRNVSIIANYIKERTKNAQFIVISLRNHMFEMADLLVGIYKTQDISKSVAVNPNLFETKKPPNYKEPEALENGKRPLPLPPPEVAGAGAKRSKVDA
mmetsp:Transcript_87519/g.194542  ORF Transcript_87519/g.194542 Transcript_87519/m.194542 type:complete len:1508 (+) Transcript_87519:95-4618(+)